MTAPRRSLLPRALAVLAPLLAAACSRGDADEPWNVVLVTLDTTRADYLRAYGFEGGVTETFDALAAEGALFETALATSAVTPVSHASILTGLNQYRHGLRVLSAKSGFKLPESVPTLATLLGERGYRTGAVHSAFPVSGYFGFDRGFDTFESFSPRMTENPDGTTSWDVADNQRRSDDTTDLAIDFVQRGTEPFFLWIHYWDPHDGNLLPPPEELPRFSRNPLKARMELYAAEVQYVDRQFGRLVSLLKDRGLWDRTLVIVTADHGEGLGEHGWQAHRILYQEQIHVPLILRVPGGPAGRRVPDVVSTIDIAPTVLDYLDVGAPTELDGQSLRGLVEGRAEEPRWAYADQINGYDLNARMVQKRPQADFLYALVYDGWKLIYRPGWPELSELYNLREDPDEATNLYDREVEIRNELLQELARRNSWVTSPFEQGADFDPAAAAAAEGALGDLGYVGGEDVGHESDASWAWTCSEHPEVVADERGRCSRCERYLVLVRRR